MALRFLDNTSFDCLLARVVVPCRGLNLPNSLSTSTYLGIHTYLPTYNSTRPVPTLVIGKPRNGGFQTAYSRPTEN
jgi:hypothetical protein